MKKSQYTTLSSQMKWEKRINAVKTAASFTFECIKILTGVTLFLVFFWLLSWFFYFTFAPVA